MSCFLRQLMGKKMVRMCFKSVNCPFFPLCGTWVAEECLILSFVVQVINIGGSRLYSIPEYMLSGFKQASSCQVSLAGQTLTRWLESQTLVSSSSHQKGRPTSTKSRTNQRDPKVNFDENLQTDCSPSSTQLFA